MFWVQRPFETVFQSISGRLPERGRNKIEIINKMKQSKQFPPAPVASAYYMYYQISKTPKHSTFTQYHRKHPTTPLVFTVIVEFLSLSLSLSLLIFIKVQYTALFTAIIKLTKKKKMNVCIVWGTDFVKVNDFLYPHIKVVIYI